ncbi:MAG: lytic murein transglycosylase [Pseudomonadota bacterium]|nr:lytic murein transglycosylase [Pseudomonadota bacterium]
MKSYDCKMARRLPGWIAWGVLCLGWAGLLRAEPAAVTQAPAPEAQQQADFSQCVAQLQQRALAEAIDPRVVETQLGAVSYVARVIELDRRQPEFTETFHNYLGQRVNQQRIETGRRLLKQHYDLLMPLTHQYGIPPQYLVAFWGLETNFGSYLGKMNVLDSLTTLACDPRRSEFFTQELMEALRLVEAGVADHGTMLGSWAGAMGNMQFMPSAYRRFALDADGDNKADLWNSLPDAFTSAAHFLNQLGWERNLRWGREVRLPPGFDYALAGRDVHKPLSGWRRLGITDVAGNRLPDLPLTASVIVPSGHRGPAFVVYRNFDVIMGWNRSEYYALAVGHLADRINGGGELSVTPPNDERLTLATVQWVQGGLAQAGYDVGPVDGIFGTRTKRALRDLQKSRGWVADGYLSDETLEQLRTVLPTEPTPSQSGEQP